MTIGLDPTYSDVYNFTMLDDGSDLTPYQSLPLYRASHTITSIVKDSANHTREKLKLAFELKATPFEKIKAQLGAQVFQEENPYVHEFNTALGKASSVADKISIICTTKTQAETIIREHSNHTPHLRQAAHFKSRDISLNIKELQKALLDQRFLLLEEKNASPKSVGHSFNLLKIATAISNIQILLGKNVQHPQALVEESPALMLRHINDLHEHKLNHDESYKERLAKVVHNIFPLGQNIRYKPTDDEGVAGINGSYFVEDNTKKAKCAVFKPYKEQNLLGFDRSLSDFGKIARGVYLLDMHNQGKAGVPVTVVSNARVKNNSFLSAPVEQERGHMQAFVENLGPYANLKYAEKKAIPVSEVHRQITFRGRIFDPDAHRENLLWTLTDKGTIKLLPIDLDYSLVSLDDPQFKYVHPRNCLDELKQADESYGRTDIEWIKSWDIDKDASMLRNLEVNEGSIQLMRLSSWLFQLGCEKKTPNELLRILQLYSFKTTALKVYNGIYKDNTLSIEDKHRLFEVEMNKEIETILRNEIPRNRFFSWPFSSF